ncbi:MAG TPA: tRNA (guanosine(46)-N7)-methyltransferase TrmB [Candidatus Anaerobiospirillum stercoravium]|nr:tRNA (guanosine(46)-N7)-methyltransferase TrmB [Candidatus Anaerobiospirillum stercoravium]
MTDDLSHVTSAELASPEGTTLDTPNLDEAAIKAAKAQAAAEREAAHLKEHPEHRVKSFVIRAGRMTTAQTKALEDLSPKYLVDVSALERLDCTAIFGREAPLVVEIGFGMGKSFVEMAQKDPLRNYLGIEVHPPGVGACMLLIEELGLTNVKVIKYDAFEVLTKCLGPESIDILQIFFPDPWPKARHHKRRLVNDSFLQLVTPLLKHGGEIRMATDWENYAEQMLECLNRAPELKNTAPDGGYLPRPEWRPLTKFEQRGERLGHGVWDLVFTRV